MTLSQYLFSAFRDLQLGSFQQTSQGLQIFMMPYGYLEQTGPQWRKQVIFFTAIFSTKKCGQHPTLVMSILRGSAEDNSEIEVLIGKI